jgi:hypothetical protein
MGKKKVKTPISLLKKDKPEIDIDIRFEVNACI